MSDLINQIRRAQMLAGEQAVVDNLRRMGLADECQTRAERDAPAALVASTASEAAAKAANEAYTQGRLRAGLQVCGMHVDRSRLFTEDGTLLAMAFTTLESASEADARRLAACWNACQDVPTETLEACASWADIVKAPLSHRHHIPAEAAAVGAVLDPESLEQGEPA